MTPRAHEQLSQGLLTQLSSRGEARDFARGDMLFQEGEHSDSLYILISGELKVFTRGGNGRELIYNVLRPGEFFGELFLDGGPRSASVQATADSRCVVVGPEEFRAFLGAFPEFAECLVLTLIARVRRATEQLRDMVMKDVYQRAAALLTELAVDEGDGMRAIDPAITQQEIANRIGATREMVNHVIRDLIRGGFLLRTDDRRIVLVKELPQHW